MADNNDIMNDVEIDEILGNIKSLTGDSDNQKLWSLDEIDALLNDEESEPQEVEINSVDSYMEKILTGLDENEETTEAEKDEYEPEPADVEETFLLDDAFVDEIADEEEAADEQYEPETTESYVAKTEEDDVVVSTDETEDYIPEEAETEASEDLTGFTEGFRHEEPVVETFDDNDGLGLIEFARKKSVIDNVSPADEENISVDDALKIFDDDAPEEAQADEQEAEITPLYDGAQMPEEEEHEEDTEQEEPEAQDDVPGQISIEKTRLFNEVETRAVRNSNIDHNIGNKIFKTGSVNVGTMETDPYRERFLNRPELDIEKTQEHRDLLDKLPPKTIEKHGVVIKKSDIEKTSEDGLSPMPILVDAADEYDAQQRLEMETQAGALKSNAIPGEEQLDNQIVLDGFDSEEEIQLVNEAEEEEKLRKIRKDRASKFRLFPNLSEENDDTETDETAEQAENDAADEEAEAEVDGEAVEDSEEPEVQEETAKETVRVAREFFGPKDAKAVYEIFLKEKSSQKLKIIVSAAALAVMVISSFIVSAFGSFALFADSPLVYVAINLLLLIVVAALNAKQISQGVQQFIKHKITSGGAVAVSLACGIIQCLVAFGFSDIVASGSHIYASVAIFPVLIISIGDYIKTKNDLDNFILLNKEQGNFYAVKQVEDESVAFEIGRGLMIKDPDIRYSAKVNFPDKFVEMSKTSIPSQAVFKLVLPVAAVASVIVGAISGIINSNLFVGVSAFTGVLLMGIPSAVVLSSAEYLKKTNKALNSQGGMVSGYEAIEDVVFSNAVVLDASDMFEDGGSKIYGMKLFGSTKIDEAILYTAAVVIESDGALKDVFDGIILNKRELLPPVESLAYEERLGCSGWIYNYRVLVGNRDLLVKHNIEVLSKEEESKFIKGGRQVVYLAVEGKVAAMFVVGYKADRAISAYLRQLEKNGIGILVRTADANITEELIEQHFSLPHNYVKVISPVAGMMFKQLREQEVHNEPCKLLHNGKVSSMLHTITAAFNVGEQLKIATVLQYIGIGIGVLVMALFSFLSGMSQVGAIQLLLFETLWLLLVVFVPRIKKI